MSTHKQADRVDALADKLDDLSPDIRDAMWKCAEEARAHRGLRATLHEVLDWTRTDYEAAGTDAADVLGQIEDLVSRKLREVSK